MDDRVKACMLRACVARQNALTSGDDERKQSWTIMAAIWDEMAKEYRDMDAEKARVKQAEARGRSATADVIHLIFATDPAGIRQAK